MGRDRQRLRQWARPRYPRRQKPVLEILLRSPQPQHRLINHRLRPRLVWRSGAGRAEGIWPPGRSAEVRVVQGAVPSDQEDGPRCVQLPEAQGWHQGPVHRLRRQHGKVAAAYPGQLQRKAQSGQRRLDCSSLPAQQPGQRLQRGVVKV